MRFALKSALKTTMLQSDFKSSRDVEYTVQHLW